MSFTKSIPKIPNIFNQYFKIGCKLTKFKCLDDTYTFALGAIRAAKILSEYQRNINLLEPACGSGLVGLHLLKKKLVKWVEGFDVDFSAVELSFINANLLNCHNHQTHFFKANLLNIQKIIKNLKYKPHLLICNPPWIPIPEEMRVPEIIDGGLYGTKFTPYIFKLFKRLKVKIISLNTSSVSSIKRTLKEVEFLKLRLIEVIICFNFFGEFTSQPKIQNHIRNLKDVFISSHTESKKFMRTNQDLYLIINLIISIPDVFKKSPISTKYFLYFLECFQKYGLWATKFYQGDSRFHFYYWSPFGHNETK